MTSAYVEIPSHTLIFGNITMTSDGTEPPDANGCVYRVKGQDTVLGNPAPVTVALLSLMRVGSLETWDRTDNREPVLRVTLRADDSNVLALGEKALQAECEKSNTLTWIPPDGAGDPSVFDIAWSSLELVFDFNAELRHERTYLVHLAALPHAREDTLVVTPAAPTSPTYTMVDDGSALSGSGFSWTSSSPSVTLSVVSGRIRATRSSGSSDFSRFYRTADVTYAAGDYLSVDFASSNFIVTNLHMFGTPAPDPVAREDVGGGVTRFYFGPAASAQTPHELDFFFYGTSPAPLSASYVEVDQVRKASAIPNIGTARQKALSIVPGGSVPTQGSIAVEHATSALGKTIVFSHKTGTGYLPALSPYRVSGDARTTDSTLLSGGKATLTGVTTWNVPVSALPRGRVEVWAWLTASATTTFILNWSLFSYMGSTALSSDAYTKSLSLSGWTLVCLGAATMPPVDIGPAGYVAVQMQASGGGTPLVSYDEVYLFATDEGRLTIVDCSTGSPAAGGPSNRLFIDAPSPDNEGRGAVYRGNAADRSDQWQPSTSATVWSDHDFDPDGTSIFVATQNALDAATSLTHYRRYHTHVARDT